MCDPVTAAAATAMALKAGGQIAQGISGYQAGKAQEKMSQAEARSAIEVGELDVGRIRKEGEAFMGTQRAIQGASGVDIASGSPAEVSAESARNIELDLMTRRYQARVGAWGHTIAGRQAAARGSAALTQGIIAGTSTILTTAGDQGWFKSSSAAPKGGYGKGFGG